MNNGTANIPNYDRADVPPHVDPNLVFEFDYFNPAGLEQHGDFYRAVAALQGGPDILWSPLYGGHWIVTRAEDIKWVQENYDFFSHEHFQIPRGAMIHMPPITVDPPLHSRYRAVLNPPFTKGRVEQIYEPKARDLTIALIESLKAKGRCEFVSEFAQIMPVSIFLGIVDLPVERRQEFIGWAREYSTARGEAKEAALRQVMSYLKQIIDEREKDPGEDLLSRIAGWRSNPRCQGEHEVMGMAMLVFVGGLDTVAAQLSFATWYLARHPELHGRMRQDPSIIPAVVEEFLRRHGLSNTGRLVKAPIERKGARFMPGEMVLVPINVSGLDDRAYENPLQIDFDRDPAPHNTFGNGPHKCVGATLARMEFRVFLEEWTARMPAVRLDPSIEPWTHAGPIPGMTRLNLEWDV